MPGRDSSTRGGRRLDAHAGAAHDGASPALTVVLREAPGADERRWDAIVDLLLAVPDDPEDDAA